MKIREIIIGPAETKVPVYLARAEAAWIVAIPEFEWSCRIADHEGTAGIDDYRALHERICKSLRRPLTYSEAELVTDEIIDWIGE